MTQNPVPPPPPPQSPSATPTPVPVPVPRAAVVVPIERKPVVVPEPPAEVHPEEPQGGSWLGRFIFLIILVGVLGAIYLFRGQIVDLYTSYFPSTDSSTGSDSSGGGHHHGGGGGAHTAPLPVVVATAQKGSIDVYQNGLGSVTAFYSAIIKTRVAGQLMDVKFVEGQIVKQGDLIAEIDPRPYQVQLEQDQAQLLHDQALLQNSQLDLQRYQTLWDQNSVSKQTLDAQKALVSENQGTVQVDQAAIDAVKLNLVYTQITAPFTGQMGIRAVDPGNYVQPSDSSGLVVINQIEPITVLFTVPEDNMAPILNSLTSGEHLPVLTYSRDMSKQLATGTLLTSDNQIDSTTGTLKLRASFPNTDHSLFPNQFVNARILIDTKKDILLVPKAAIQHGQDANFVYAVKQDEAGTSSVEVKAVTVGATDDDHVEITGGLDEGTQVIIDGVDKLQAGSKVIPQTSETPQAPATDGSTPSPTPHHHRHSPSPSPSPSDN